MTGHSEMLREPTHRARGLLGMDGARGAEFAIPKAAESNTVSVRRVSPIHQGFNERPHPLFPPSEGKAGSRQALRNASVNKQLPVSSRFHPPRRVVTEGTCWFVCINAIWPSDWRPRAGCETKANKAGRRESRLEARIRDESSEAVI